MVAMGTARLTPAAPDLSEVTRAELVEELASMVNRIIRLGRADSRAALCLVEVIRTLLAEAPRMEDFVADLDAAARTLRRHIST